MADYIERTKELMLAMNAGARAIENNRAYHGTTYVKDVFADNPESIPYLQAARVLRDASENAVLSATDVAPVVLCKNCKWFADNNGGEWYGCKMFQVVRITPEDAPKPDDFCSWGESKCAGRGAKMDGGSGNGK